MTTATQPRKTRKESKPGRSLRLYPGSPALLEMAIGKEEFSYWLVSLGCELGGLAFELKKSLPEGTVYHVRLDGKHSTCECPGHLRWNHCKHVEALLALQAQGKLPAAPQAAPESAPCCDFDNNF
jgi:hypothetical protein